MIVSELIVKHHPDKNSGEASAVFLAVSQAWQTLSSPDSREGGLLDSHLA